MPHEQYVVLPWFWLPRENVRERGQRDGAPYETWAGAGLIELTPGNAIDYEAVRRRIEALAATYRIREIAFDRWGATQMSQELTGAGLTLVETGMGYASMSAPTRELLALTLRRGLAHGGHPVLRWQADNMTVAQDPAGNVKPVKRREVKRIDGMVALIMALDRATRQEAPRESVYATRGMQVIG